MDVPNATDTDIQVARNLRSLRHQNRMTLQAMASHLSVSYQQIQKYENGQDRITAGRLYQFAVIYDVSVETFFHPMEA